VGNRRGGLLSDSGAGNNAFAQAITGHAGQVTGPVSNSQAAITANAGAQAQTARSAEAEPPQELPRSLLMNMARAIASRGQSEVTLKHATLGAIKLQIAMKQGSVDLRVVAGRTQTASLLRGSESSLRQRIAQHGLKLNRMRVEVEGQRGSNRRSRGGDDSIDMEV